MDQTDQHEVARYVARMRKLADQLNAPIEVIIGAVQLRRLDVLSKQLYNQGYRAGYEALLDDTAEVPKAQPDRTWGSPATNARLVD